MPSATPGPTIYDLANLEAMKNGLAPLAQYGHDQAAIAQAQAIARQRQADYLQQQKQQADLTFTRQAQLERMREAAAIESMKQQDAYKRRQLLEAAAQRYGIPTQSNDGEVSDYDLQTNISGSAKKSVQALRQRLSQINQEASQAINLTPDPAIASKLALKSVVDNPAFMATLKPDDAAFLRQAALSMNPSAAEDAIRKIQSNYILFGNKAETQKVVAQLETERDSILKDKKALSAATGEFHLKRLGSEYEAVSKAIAQHSQFLNSNDEAEANGLVPSKSSTVTAAKQDDSEIPKNFPVDRSATTTVPQASEAEARGYFATHPNDVPPDTRDTAGLAQFLPSFQNVSGIAGQTASMLARPIGVAGHNAAVAIGGGNYIRDTSDAFSPEERAILEKAASLIFPNAPQQPSLPAIGMGNLRSAEQRMSDGIPNYGGAVRNITGQNVTSPGNYQELSTFGQRDPNAQMFAVHPDQAQAISDELKRRAIEAAMYFRPQNQ